MAEDGGLESAIRCDIGLKVACISSGILTNKVGIGLICLTTSI
jgi:hypothetical protein